MRWVPQPALQLSAPVRGSRVAIIGLVCMLALAACGGDGSGVKEDRRYATDPGQPATATSAVATGTAPPTSEPTSSPLRITPEASPASIASTTEIVYALVDGAVVAVDVRTGQTRVLTRSRDDERVVRIAASPEGAAVAIVRRTGADDASVYDLEIRDRQGDVVTTWRDIEELLGDVDQQGEGRVAIDWSERGGKIAVTFPNGGAVLMPVTGDTAILLTRQQAPAPLSIEWSPSGDAIAFTSRMPGSRSAYLAIASVQALPVDPVQIGGTGGERPVYDLGWLPGGSTLLAVQGSAALQDQVGGDLIQVDRRTLSARFAIGANRFGPSAEIVTVEPSPDGQQWAIVTVAPDARGGLTATVWLVSPDVSTVIRIDLPEDPPVAGVTWTVDGLSITLFEPDRVRLVTVDRDGAVVPVDVPSASPEASPDLAGTPAATPMAPPIAQPDLIDATPLATPAASPATGDSPTPDD
jgi:hypothetical protein